MTYHEWHEINMKAKQLVEASRKMLARTADPVESGLAAQVVIDHLWRLGFRPRQECSNLWSRKTTKNDMSQ